MEKTATIAIIGAGNMGTSLLGGLMAAQYPAKKIWIADPSSEKLGALQKKFPINITTNNSIAVKTADVVLFAIKPQTFPQAARALANTLPHPKPLVISIAAGISVASIQYGLDRKIPLPIIRCMPNTPALIGCGASVLYANTHVSSKQRKIAESIFRAVGIALWLEDEKLMDAATALSGSGPAYFYLIIEALQLAGEKLGLPAAAVRLLTLQTAQGAAQMAFQSEKNIIELRQAVTSPGGTTEQAIQVLEKANIRAIIMETLLAAKQRSEELAAIFSQEIGE
jgi:pyrroline-5-carboxylate reductase